MWVSLLSAPLLHEENFCCHRTTVQRIDTFNPNSKPVVLVLSPLGPLLTPLDLPHAVPFLNARLIKKPLVIPGCKIQNRFACQAKQQQASATW
jgi:hypothetical protein